MDNISEMLTIIRNALAVSKQEVSVPFSELKHGILQIFEKEGFIGKVEKKGKKFKKTLEVTLKYNDDGTPTMSGLKRISKPGQRIYVGYNEIKPIKDGYGIAVVSTSKGLLSNKEARKQKVGGELICEIW